jgi:predicted peptidase
MVSFQSMLSLTLSIFSFAAPAQTETQYLSRSATVGSATYNYKVYLPAGWKRENKAPVILFLHGAGERGDDNTAQTRVGLGPAIAARKDFPFIVVLPQCPRGRWWSEPEMQAQALKAFDQTVEEFNGDRSRVYLTGLSMGGYGLWAIASANPGRFAALAPVCGGIRPPRAVTTPPGTADPNAAADPYAEAAKKVGKTPVWVFHGGADSVVPVSESQKMVESLRAIGGQVRYNEYEGVGHNSWDRAYGEAELFTWMLSHRLEAKK